MQCFNSSMVRLLLIGNMTLQVIQEVSIPQWYDYYITAFCKYHLVYGFNSSMVRLLHIG